MKVKYDEATTEWFKENQFKCTTVCKCERCGLFYKPALGNECEEEEK